MHRSLEFEDFESLDDFMQAHRVDYESYLNVLRAGITRPKVFIKRLISDKWINNFNPWIANVLNSNMDIQFILDEYSCAAYVVDYVNKSNRGISNLHRELNKLRDEYPDKDFHEILSLIGKSMLDNVEISSQEAAWYLLNLHMSESSRRVISIPTVWPNEREKIRKTTKEMDDEELEESSKNIWRDNNFDKYIRRPPEMENISLAEFVSKYNYNPQTKKYSPRRNQIIIRYRNYDMNLENDEYKREMVLLHIPYRNEEIEFLNNYKYRQIYEEKLEFITESRKMFESNLDIQTVLEECHRLIREEEEDNEQKNLNFEKYEESREIDDDFVQNIRDNPIDDDVLMKIMENMSCVVRKRENIMSKAEYCQKICLMNEEQRNIILESIDRLFDGIYHPLQIFLTGPAGSGKTYVIKMMMETYNRFAQSHNEIFNSYVATASTANAAAQFDGTTVHSAFRLTFQSAYKEFSLETINNFRAAFKNVRLIIIDEISMIGAVLLENVDRKLRRIFHTRELFGGLHTILCGDLRQLAAVRQTPVYRRLPTQSFSVESVWQQFMYYPLTEIVRQKDVQFSNTLTKIGDGVGLTTEEILFLESRFTDEKYLEEHEPTAIRLFHTTEEVKDYNNKRFQGSDVIDQVAKLMSIAAIKLKLNLLVQEQRYIN